MNFDQYIEEKTKIIIKEMEAEMMLHLGVKHYSYTSTGKLEFIYKNYFTFKIFRTNHNLYVFSDSYIKVEGKDYDVRFNKLANLIFNGTYKTIEDLKKELDRLVEIFTTDSIRLKEQLITDTTFKTVKNSNIL